MHSYLARRAAIVKTEAETLRRAFGNLTTLLGDDRQQMLFSRHSSTPRALSASEISTRPILLSVRCSNFACSRSALMNFDGRRMAKTSPYSFIDVCFFRCAMMGIVVHLPT
jgi:hypothetical protein